MNLFSGTRKGNEKFCFQKSFLEIVSKIHVSNSLMFQNIEASIKLLHSMRAKSQMKFSVRMDTPYLAPIGNGEYPSGASTLLHIPQEPQGRHLVGFRGHIDIHKERCKLPSSPGHRTRAEVRSKYVHASQDIIFLKHNLAWLENSSIAFEKKTNLMDSISEGMQILTLGENKLFPYF